MLTARRLMREHGDRWPSEWLRRRDLDDWADYLDKLSSHSKIVAVAVAVTGGLIFLNGRTHAKEVLQ